MRHTANAIIAVQRSLSESNWRALTGGRTSAQRYPTAVTEAECGFDILEYGIGERFPVA